MIWFKRLTTTFQRTMEIIPNIDFAQCPNLRTVAREGNVIYLMPPNIEEMIKMCNPTQGTMIEFWDLTLEQN